MTAAGIDSMKKTDTKLRRASLVSLLGLGILGSPNPARSQEDPDENPIHDLDRVVIVASRTERPLDQTGSTVEILEASDINKSKQPFLLDNLRYVPGFYLRNNGGPGGVFGITLRGLNANPPAVLIDGVEVDNPGDGQIINFGNLFGANVSRVEILKGPQSSLYGANALSGVISVRTKDGREDPGSHLDLSYGAHDTVSGSLGTRGAEGAWSYAFNANYFHQRFSVQDKSFGPEWEDDDTYENVQGSLKLGYQIGEKSSLDFFAYGFDSHSDFDPGDPDSLFGPPELVNHTETEQFFSRLGGDFELNEQWRSTLGVAFTDVETVTVSGGRFPSIGERLRYDWKNVVEITEAWTLVGGIEIEEEDNQSDGSQRDNTSLFLENVVRASDNLDWTLGGRYDDNSVYGDETTGRATFSHRLGDTGGRIRGSYGTSFQAPSFFQLFSSFGDPNLAPESGEGWDLAYERVLADGKIFFSSTLFGNDVRDKIIFSFDSFTYANEDRYKSKGLENALRFQTAENATVTIAHTYSDAQYADGTEAERVPRHIVSAGFTWKVSQPFSLSAQAIAVTSQFSLRSDTTKQEGYAVVNLTGRYDINDQWQWWARIDNLFDEDYVEVLTYETPGFSLYGGANIRF